jgi:hypothetical protein
MSLETWDHILFSLFFGTAVIGGIVLGWITLRVTLSDKYRSLKQSTGFGSRRRNQKLAFATYQELYPSSRLVPIAKALVWFSFGVGMVAVFLIIKEG